MEDWWTAETISALVQLVLAILMIVGSGALVQVAGWYKARRQDVLDNIQERYGYYVASQVDLFVRAAEEAATQKGKRVIADKRSWVIAQMAQRGIPVTEAQVDAAVHLMRLTGGETKCAAQ